MNKNCKFQFGLQHNFSSPIGRGLQLKTMKFELNIDRCIADERSLKIIRSVFCVCVFMHQANMTSVVESCNQYRTYSSIQDSWITLTDVFNYYAVTNEFLRNFSQPGSFNDPDQVWNIFTLSPRFAVKRVTLWRIKMKNSPTITSSITRTITITNNFRCLKFQNGLVFFFLYILLTMTHGYSEKI